MRYIKCHECGSTEVPTLATCPTCGIKTPIEIRQRWWLLGVVLLVGAGVGVAVSYGAFGGAVRIRRLEDHVADLEQQLERERARPDRTAPLRRELARTREERDSLRGDVEALRRRQPSGPTDLPVPLPADDRWRLAHVQWAAAYQSLARLWRAPYVPLGFVRQMDADMGTLETCTQQLAAVLADTPDRPSLRTSAQALNEFRRHLVALRQAVRAERRRRVTVSAQSDWVDSDVEVGSGDLVYVRAQGSWAMTIAAVVSVDGGEDEAPLVECVPLVGALPLGAVLWRVADGERTHALLPDGTSDAVRVEAAGAIRFRINEQRLDDNAGAMTVEVMVVPKWLIAALDAAGTQLIGG